MAAKLKIKWEQAGPGRVCKFSYRSYRGTLGHVWVGSDGKWWAQSNAEEVMSGGHPCAASAMLHVETLCILPERVQIMIDAEEERAKK